VFNTTWAIVELMGHRTRAGLVSEVELFGAKMLRIDIPGVDSPAHYSAAAIYGITVCSEETARNHWSTPRQRWLAEANEASDDGGPPPLVVDVGDLDEEKTSERYGSAEIEARESALGLAAALQSVAAGAEALGVKSVELRSAVGDHTCDLLAAQPGAVVRATLYSDRFPGSMRSAGPYVIQSVTVEVGGVAISGQRDARPAAADELPMLGGEAALELPDGRKSVDFVVRAPK
jgi:hypothetical protein